MKYEIFKSIYSNEWHWRLVAANGKIIAVGESYTRKGNCLAAIDIVKGSGGVRVVMVKQ